MARPACPCCQRGLPRRGRPRCPECAHVFRGAGWDGIDAHWRARHQEVRPYEAFWAALCDEHRAAEPLRCLCCAKGIPPDLSYRQCPECALVLRGPGWGGIEAHWRARHQASLGYEEFWGSLCPAHRGSADPATAFLPFGRR